MNDATEQVEPGWQVVDGAGTAIGSVDAVFVDYLLVRTRGLMPIDMYVPANAISEASDGRVVVDGGADEARERWRRPLRRAPHAER